MVWGVICLAISVIGFWPSYFGPIVAGSYMDIVPVVPYHVVTSYAWLLLAISQPLLISTRRISLHRQVGILGAFIAAAVVVTGVITQIDVMSIHASRGDIGNAVMTPFFRFVAIAVFAVCITLAIAQRRRSDYHKRWIVLGTIGLLEAPISRFYFHVLEVEPQTAGLSAAISRVLLMAAFLAWDWRTLGRAHPVSLWGAIVITIVVFGTAPIVGTEWWHAIAARIAATGS